MCWLSHSAGAFSHSCKSAGNVQFSLMDDVYQGELECNETDIGCFIENRMKFYDRLILPKPLGEWGREGWRFCRPWPFYHDLCFKEGLGAAAATFPPAPKHRD